MTWFAPTPTLNVALDHGRFTGEPGGGDWTNFSDRIIGWTVDLPSRTSPRSDFGPGQLEVILDNSDRLLDPSNPSGLVYAADGKCLPGAPVTFDLTYGGSTERRFTGYLTGPAWEGAGTRRIGGGVASSTVRLTASDRLAWPGNLPGSTWSIATMALHPDWYLQMDPENAVLATGSSIPDRSATTTSSATTTVPSGLARPHQGPGGWVPWMALPPDATITSDAADVMPDGDENNLTAWCWWAAETGLSAGESAMVMKMVEPGGSTRRWAIWIDDAGVANVETYDSGGSVVDSDTITGFSRWDNSQGHFVVARITSGNTLKVWFGGFTATLTATTILYESDLVNGPADVDTYVDEVTLFRRSLTDEQVAGVLLDAGGYIGQWFGQTYTDRLASWAEAGGVDITVDWTNGMRVPVDDPDVEGFVSLGVAGLPQNIADAWRQTVAPLGTVVCNRYGFLVARTVHAFTSGDYDAEYVTTSAHFTDDATALSSPYLRHAGVARSAVDDYLVVNRIGGACYYLISLGPPVDLQPLTFRPEATATVGGRTSREQHGVRKIDMAVERYGWQTAASAAQLILDRYAWPTEAGFARIELDAAADDDLVAWLMTAEPELAVSVTYTDANGDVHTVEGLNLQGLSLSGDTTTLRATARAFRS